MDSIIKRLDSFIEYAKAIRKFSDVAFYEDVKSHIVQLEIDNADLHKNLVESNIWLAEANSKLSKINEYPTK